MTYILCCSKYVFNCLQFGALTIGMNCDIHVLSYDFLFWLNDDIHADFLVYLETFLDRQKTPKHSLR